MLYQKLLQPLPVVATIGGKGICPAHRFTVELPPGLLEKNIQLGNLVVPPHMQSQEELEAIVKEARMTQAMLKPNWVE